MKQTFVIVMFLLSGWVCAGPLEGSGRVSHIVLVQLKNSADTGRFLAMSKRLVKLPGVKRYSIGPMLPKEGSERIDYDVGVVVTLENRQALSDYLRHPQHQEIIDSMRPLVERIEVHDFITR